jgi:phosphomannomutase / phosphoglucomutase
MALKIPPSIFREYDVRGIAGRDISPEFAECLGMAYGKMAREKSGMDRMKIAIGWDCRLTSDDYATALVNGVRKAGHDVIQLGVCPTPLTYFSIFHLKLDGGIMVTGSHNPADYNGFKICIGKDTIHGHQIQELKKEMEAIAPRFGHGSGEPDGHYQTGTVGQFDIIPAYVDFLAKHARPSQKKLKVVLDAGNGTASTVAPLLFERLGAQVIPLYCKLDGRFPNHHPDPTVVENLKDLIATVRREKADMGIAFDGDSDRIGLVDENGRAIFGDELMVIYSRQILREKPGATIISEVKSSHKLYNDIAANGGKPIMWKTGHSLIKSKMKETQAALAGEMSGHIFFADRYFGYDDAIYAALRIYEIACEHKGPVSSLLAGLPETISTPEIRVDCEEEKKFQLVEETKRRLAAKHKINDIDGVRVDFGDGWGLVRASNTQPVLVLRFEAPTQARMNELRSIVETELKAAAQAIGHPPIRTDVSAGH